MCDWFCSSQILVIIVLIINVTSSGLHGVVWFSQTLSVTAMVCLVLAQVEFSINLIYMGLYSLVWLYQLYQWDII